MKTRLYLFTSEIEKLKDSMLFHNDMDDIDDDEQHIARAHFLMAISLLETAKQQMYLANQSVIDK